MTAERVRELALAMPESTEGSHMGHPDFRVRNKIFVSLMADGARCALKCDPVSLDALVCRHPKLYSDAWAGRWLGIDLRRASDQTVAALLEDAWRLVAPKRLVTDYDRTHSTALRPAKRPGAGRRK